MTVEEKLTSEGWQKQATYDEPRLSEMVAMYQEIGLDVRLEPVDAAGQDGCTGCLQIFPDRFKTIYTRQQLNRDDPGKNKINHESTK